MNKIIVKFKWEIGGWNDKKTIIPVMDSYFVGNYSDYLNNKIKYFFKNEKIKINFDYEDYLFRVLFDGGYDDYSKIVPLLEKCILEVEKIKLGLSRESFLEMGEGYGAEIKKDGVLLYFLYDFDINGDFSIVSLECFYEVLIKWVNFLKEGPNLEKKVEFECKIK